MALDTFEALGYETADDRLAQLSASGSERAFAVLVERYQLPLTRYCHRLGVATDDIDDVLQGTFVAAWAALQSGTRVEAVRAWLYRIARHQAIDRHRRQVRDEPLPDTLVGRGERDVDVLAEVNATLGALQDLPAAQRQALLGTAVHGRSHHEVAGELGMTDTAVRGLVFRARARLRDAVGILVGAPFTAVPRRLGLSGAELGGGGEVSSVVKIVAVTLSAGALAGGAGVAIENTSTHRAPASAAHRLQRPVVSTTPATGEITNPRGSSTTAQPQSGDPTGDASPHAPRTSPPVKAHLGGGAAPGPLAAEGPRRPAAVAEPPSGTTEPPPAQATAAAPAPTPTAARGGSGADDPLPGGHGPDDPVAALPDDHGGTVTTAPTSSPPPSGGGDDAAAAQPSAPDDHGGRH